jgi:hypothetical protein
MGASLPLKEHKLPWISIPYKEIDEAAWNPGTLVWRRLYAKGFFPLEDAATIFVGTTTNADNVFILENTKLDRGKLLAFSAEEDRSVELDPEICIPFLRGKDISRYRVANPSVAVLFPYRKDSTRAELIDQRSLSSQYPLAWNYLRRHHSRLEARENGKWQGQDNWYCHAYPRNHSQIHRAKLLSPDICDHGRWTLDSQGSYHCLNTAYGVSEAKFGYELTFLLALLNSKVFESFMREHSVNLRGGYYRVTKTFMSGFPVPRIDFAGTAEKRKQLTDKSISLYRSFISNVDQRDIIYFTERQLNRGPKHADSVHDLLAHLAQQMINLHEECQQLERGADLFSFLLRNTPCLQLSKILGGPLSTGELLDDFSTVRHDIEDLRWSQEAEGSWRLEVQAKLRDPESGWRKHQRDQNGKLIRQWMPVYRLELDEQVGRFYHYVFANLKGFDGTGRFPGGSTRTLLQKLHATKVPQFVPVDLTPLVELETELNEVKRRIRLTDELIDQIVYKLYGLTEEEIAIVGGRDH